MELKFLTNCDMNVLNLCGGMSEDASTKVLIMLKLVSFKLCLPEEQSFIKPHEIVRANIETRLLLAAGNYFFLILLRLLTFTCGQDLLLIATGDGRL